MRRRKLGNSWLKIEVGGSKLRRKKYRLLRPGKRKLGCWL